MRTNLIKHKHGCKEEKLFQNDVERNEVNIHPADIHTNAHNYEVGSDSRSLSQLTEKTWALKVLNTIILLSLDPSLLPPTASSHNFTDMAGRRCQC